MFEAKSARWRMGDEEEERREQGHEARRGYNLKNR
jgi:hypothetical protein